MKTQIEIRAAFWESHPEYHERNAKRVGRTRLYRRVTQNDYPADVRMSFVDYVDHLARSGEISEALAGRVTL